MDAVFTPAANRLSAPLDQRESQGWRAAFVRILTSMVHATAARMPLTQDDVPPEWFHYPLP
ncbi:MAG TPA: hypothetical protein VHY35_11745 [Stellaceae bacterium]|jgi:hypothetical protein|nr:hypothetical protein [Stellaceae bacterium]